METRYPETAKGLAEQLRHALLDHEAFEMKLRPCTLERCKATCCYDGVYLSAEEADGLRVLVSEQRERLQAYGLDLPDEAVVMARGGRAQKTATREAKPGELAEDYPEHFPKTRCVFLDSIGRCGIQRMNMEDAVHPWLDKPLTCWIHPIAIQSPKRGGSRSLITMVPPDKDPQKEAGYPGFASCTHCGRPEAGGQPAHLVLEEELKMLGELAGRDFLAELRAPKLEP
ncbi:DUF3109 family protein [Rubritalea marina]|uniref:DUF3109 family protein n=1 Tax=Rubritalea marina TaxID=361055 RepID=UPI000379DDD8|nr:DUF3109 family protein [Rubritalea marina]